MVHVTVVWVERGVNWGLGVRAAAALCVQRQKLDCNIRRQLKLINAGFKFLDHFFIPVFKGGIHNNLENLNGQSYLALINQFLKYLNSLKNKEQFLLLILILEGARPGQQPAEVNIQLKELFRLIVIKFQLNDLPKVLGLSSDIELPQYVALVVSALLEVP